MRRHRYRVSRILGGRGSPGSVFHRVHRSFATRSSRCHARCLVRQLDTRIDPVRIRRVAVLAEVSVATVVFAEVAVTAGCEVDGDLLHQ